MLYFKEVDLLKKYNLLSLKTVAILIKVEESKDKELKNWEKDIIVRAKTLVDEIYRGALTCEGKSPGSIDGLAEGMFLCGFAFLAINDIRNKQEVTLYCGYSSFLKDTLMCLKTIENKRNGKPYQISINFAKEFFVNFAGKLNQIILNKKEKGD